ncbi:MAG: DNA-binding protein WhiA [Coriobacteriales bacterium]|nr:DNA-binding protein WhiA [Coriobacteriales bacterium]
MSFTAEVKDELSRVDGHCPECAVAELSALMRVCGTLSFRGSGRYSIRIATETGAVARTVIKYAHKLLDLDTQLTVRRSVLHKTRNYLIEIPEQERLYDDLVRLGILVPGRGLASGVPHGLLQRRCCKEAFVRGAFLAGGFIADPRGDFHLEIAVTGEEFANDLVELLESLGVEARLNHRRGSYAIYLKSFDGIERLLGAMGAQRSERALQNVRKIKSVKNDVQRRVNAEIANQARSTGAALNQRLLVEQVDQAIGMRRLPTALQEFCELRRRYPDISLAALGERCQPPASKSAMYHRLLRLRELLQQAQNSSTNSSSDG